MTDEEFLNVTKAAARAGCTPKTIWGWIRAGTLPAFKTPGGQYRIKPSDIDAAMQPAPAATPEA